MGAVAITGGGTGLGLAMAREMASRGHALALISRDPGHLQAGREANLVFNHNLEDLDKDNNFRSSLSEVTIKYSY